MWCFLQRVGALAPVGLAALVLTGFALAGGATICVTAGTSSWTQDDTRPGGTVRFTNDYGAPPGLGPGSLELKTPFADNGAKAGLYTHTMAGTPLSAVYALSYWTYQAVTVPPNPAVADASYQLQIDVNGAALGGFTTLVFEPYWNPSQQAIVPGAWQRWDVDAGFFWSSRTVADLPSCVLAAGAGGPPLYTLAQVQAMCPNAVVVGIGVNVGTFNSGYTVATDGVQFNNKTYNFQVTCGDGGGGQSCGDGDDDHDGLNNQRESFFLTLAALPDTNLDGVVDGNDDANANGQSDEDEDDDVCRDRDSDGNGIDDEDEDDEAHDRGHG
jgi:hypothetical protein